jgi:hypothetical protein
MKQFLLLLLAVSACQPIVPASHKPLKYKIDTLCFKDFCYLPITTIDNVIVRWQVKNKQYYLTEQFVNDTIATKPMLRFITENASHFILLYVTSTRSAFNPSPASYDMYIVEKYKNNTFKKINDVYPILLNNTYAISIQGDYETIIITNTNTLQQATVHLSTPIAPCPAAYYCVKDIQIKDKKLIIKYETKKNIARYTIELKI